MPKPRLIELHDYNPVWPLVFQQLTDVYRHTLGDLLLRAEHVGSTSVPGLSAKPVIDIDLVVNPTDLPAAVERLTTLGYEHLGDRGRPGREAFGRPSADVPRSGANKEWPRHNLYICPTDSPELLRHTAFRDYLRDHSDAAAAYGELKRQLADLYKNDIEGYCAAKTRFIVGILKEVLPEHSYSPVIPIYILEYDPTWAQVFEQMAGVLRAKLGDLALAIEHVGSTSVPGLPAKPIIDLDVVVAEHDVPLAIEKLQELGYVHRGNRGIEGREAFERDGLDVPRDGKGTLWMVHHLYICPRNSPELRKHLAFRDYLRSHPESMQEYGRIKRELAARFSNERAAYTDAKTDFIASIMAQALK